MHEHTFLVACIPFGGGKVSDAVRRFLNSCAFQSHEQKQMNVYGS
jgi:hypothetical protein